MMHGKIVVITGASSGIGAELVQQISSLGAIPILMARTKHKLGEVAASLNGEYAIYELDVTSDEQVHQVMQEVIERYGRIDVLVNNAGFGQFEAFLSTPMDQFTEMMDVNYFGIVRCTRAVLPHMLERRNGHIVNIASMAGKIGSAKSTAYSATKHAVLGLTSSLRAELSGTGVIVSAVNPGPVDTPFFDRADPDGAYVSRVRWFMLKPEKVAREIIRVIERNKMGVDLPFTASFGVKLFQLFPALLERVIHKMMNQK